MRAKKAILSFNTLQFILRLFFLIAVSLAIVMLAQACFNMHFDIIEQESTIFYNRLFYEEPLVYHDLLSDRVHPGVFMINNLQSNDFPEKISDSIHYGEVKHIAAKIDLKGKQTATSFFNPGNPASDILASSSLRSLKRVKTKGYLYTMESAHHAHR